LSAAGLEALDSARWAAALRQEHDSRGSDVEPVNEQELLIDRLSAGREQPRDRFFRGFAFPARRCHRDARRFVQREDFLGFEQDHKPLSATAGNRRPHPKRRQVSPASAIGRVDYN
jgi:hypothetical protein